MKKTYKLFFEGASLKLDAIAQNLAELRKAWYSENFFPLLQDSCYRCRPGKGKISC